MTSRGLDMKTTQTERLLKYVRRALNRFDEVPLSISDRKSYRIAVLRGDSLEAWMARADLRPIGGSGVVRKSEIGYLHPTFDTVQLRKRDNSLKEEWLKERELKNVPEYMMEIFHDDGSGMILASSVEEFEQTNAQLRQSLVAAIPDAMTRLQAETRVLLNEQMLGRIRQRTFAYLCHCENVLTFSGSSSSIFDHYRTQVDKFIGEISPEILSQTNSAFERATEQDSESLSHALTSCRRLLVAVADLVFPSTDEVWRDSAGEERSIDQEHYINRLYAFLYEANVSGTLSRVCNALVQDLDSRIRSINKGASKGVHAGVTREEVNLCVIQTYTLCGELLSIHDAKREGTPG